MAGLGTSALRAATACTRYAAVSNSWEIRSASGALPCTGPRNNFPAATICGSEIWAISIGPLALARGLALDTRQHEDGLLGQQIGEAAAWVKRERAAVPVEGQAAFDMDADRVAQRDKIPDRAEMDIRRVVPGIVQQLRDRHAAAPQQAEADAPEPEIGKRDDRP